MDDGQFDCDMDPLLGGLEDHWGHEEDEKSRNEVTRRDWQLSMKFQFPATGDKYTKLKIAEDVENHTTAEDTRCVSTVVPKKRPVLSMLRAAGDSIVQSTYCFVVRYRYHLLAVLLWMIPMVAVSLLFVQINNLNRDLDELRSHDHSFSYHNNTNMENPLDQLRFHEEIENLQAEISKIKSAQENKLYQISSKTDRLQQQLSNVEASSRSSSYHEPDHSHILSRLYQVERKAEDNSKTWYQRLHGYFSG